MNERNAPEWNRMKSAIGAAIRRYRKEIHLTQEQLAKKVGINKHTLSDYENGNTQINMVLAYRIAVVLGVSVLDLYPAPCFLYDDESSCSQEQQKSVNTLELRNRVAKFFGDHSISAQAKMDMMLYIDGVYSRFKRFVADPYEHDPGIEEIFQELLNGEPCTEPIDITAAVDLDALLIAE